MRLVWIFAAGGIGALARYGLSVAVLRLTGAGFPWGTMAVNLLGCLLFGIVVSMAEERMLIGTEIRLILLVGFMGSFTTFSTFAFETGQLLRLEQYVWALANVAGNTVLGVVLLFAGLVLGRVF